MYFIGIFQVLFVIANLGIILFPLLFHNFVFHFNVLALSPIAKTLMFQSLYSATCLYLIIFVQEKISRKGHKDINK